MRLKLTVVFLSLAATSAAGDLRLDLPIDCTLGEDCYIQQTVDHDPTEEASDFACGPMTYDTHKGTDFALPSLAMQRAGVDVLAAADGIVMGVRDGMPDMRQIGENAPNVNGRECGNGVVIQHDDGWETQYCHLANGSVAVQSGASVTAGTILGHVGLSGQTQFPHLHLSVRHNGAVIDPFDPDGAITCGAPSNETLWSQPIDAPAGGLITAGFTAGVPDYEAIKAGSAATDEIAARDPLVVWGYVFGGQAGDTLHLRIEGPDGHVMDESTALEKTQSQLFRAVGRRPPGGGWAAGEYTGEVQMIRNGAVLDTVETVVTVR